MDAARDDTEALMRRVGQGDASAVQALFQRHRSRLAQMIQRRMDPRVRARIDPSDVIQETLATASQKMPHYIANRPLPFYPWLRQIAWEKLVHLHDRHLRAAKRSVIRERVIGVCVADDSVIELAQQIVGATSSPSAAAALGEMQQRVRFALDRLPPDDGEVLLQRYVEQMTSKEIAAVMGVSEAAVNMRHMRALERMRLLLASDPMGS